LSYNTDNDDDIFLSADMKSIV